MKLSINVEKYGGDMMLVELLGKKMYTLVTIEREIVEIADVPSTVARYLALTDDLSKHPS